MTGSAWARSGRRPTARSSAPRSLEAFGVALQAARQRWDGLTGGGMPYSDAAAAAILDLALALWPVVTAELEGSERVQDGP